RPPVRNGFKVYDVDTHVMPNAEVLDRYVDPSFRPRLAELAPYRVPAGPTADATERHQFIVCIDASTAGSSERRIPIQHSLAEAAPGVARRLPASGYRMIARTTGSRTWTTRAPMSTFSSRHHGQERLG